MSLDEIMTDIINIQTLVTAIIVAIPTSILSVYLALKKYRSEKWWEKKLECYLNTINAMNDIIRFCDDTLAEKLDIESMSDDRKKEMKNEFHKGKIVLQTQTNIGPLLISEEAYKSLRSLDSKLSSTEREDDFIKKIAGIRLEIDDCLIAIVQHAKDDLGV